MSNRPRRQAAPKQPPARGNRNVLWFLLLCAVASALVVAGLSWSGRAWAWAAVVPGGAVSAVLVFRQRGARPMHGPARWVAAGGAIAVVCALFAATAGSWYKRHVWRIAPQPGPYHLLGGCTCVSPRGLVELKLAIASAKSEQGPYQARWALSVHGQELVLHTHSQEGAPRSQMVLGGKRLHTALACMEQGVLVAQGNAASLWSWQGKSIASIALPVSLATSRDILPIEGTCTVAEPVAGTVVLPGEGRSIRVLSSGMVLHAE